MATRNYNTFEWLHDGKDEVAKNITNRPAKTARKLGDQCLVLSDSGNSNKPVWYIHDGSDWVPVWKGE